MIFSNHIRAKFTINKKFIKYYFVKSDKSLTYIGCSWIDKNGVFKKSLPLKRFIILNSKPNQENLKNLI